VLVWWTHSNCLFETRCRGRGRDATPRRWAGFQFRLEEFTAAVDDHA
jgi:hypothetical protein